jgi:DNA-binding LytR/AlgR family response regulator
MKFLILEDDIFFVRELQSIIERHFQDITIDIYTDIVNEINISIYDVFFLDLEIGDKSGFDFANRINQIIIEDVPIIFVTSHIELWKESFNYHPFWYIDKANYQEELDKMFICLKKRLEQKHAHIDIEYNGINAKIELKDILYLYKEGNYVFIVTKNKEYKIYISLKKLLKQINRLDLFLKVNSGTIISKKYVQEYNIKNNEIILKNQKSFAVSRSCKNRVKELFGGIY